MWIIIDMTEPEMLCITQNDEGWTMFFDSKPEAKEYAEREILGDYRVVKVSA